MSWSVIHSIYPEGRTLSYSSAPTQLVSSCARRATLRTSSEVPHWLSDHASLTLVTTSHYLGAYLLPTSTCRIHHNRSRSLLTHVLTHSTSILQPSLSTRSHSFSPRAAMSAAEPTNCTFVERVVDGVAIGVCRPSTHVSLKSTPVILIHGGLHGSWCWRSWQTELATAGWETFALNWYNHGNSKKVDTAVFIQRSTADVAEEIGIVAAHISSTASTQTPPILLAHSMGAMAAMKYAEQNPVTALVLLAPISSAEVGAPPIQIPCDTTTPFLPPPFPMACHMFFDGLPEDEQLRLYQQLCPESPQCVIEATRTRVSVDKQRLTCPALCFEAELDILVPPPEVYDLANMYGMELRRVKGRGHNLVLGPEWKDTAGQVMGWIAKFP